MNQEQIDHFYKWFDNYSCSFFKGDKEYDYPIKWKAEHSKRVCIESRLIHNSLPKGTSNRLISEIIALFHDLGRFEQYRRFKTFNDSISKNHAIMSIREINKHKLLHNLAKRERYIISNAIRYHNALTPPDNKDSETNHYIRLIRDADKLDILSLFADYYNKNSYFPDKVIELNLPDTPYYSKEILSSLNSNKIAKLSDLKNLNDFKLIQVGWIYDLNFKASFFEIKKRSLIERITEQLPKNKEIKKVISQALSYIDDKLV